METERVCRDCGECKPITAFQRNSHRPSSYQLDCKVCRLAQRRLQRQRQFGWKPRGVPAPIPDAKCINAMSMWFGPVSPGPLRPAIGIAA